MAEKAPLEDQPLLLYNRTRQVAVDLAAKLGGPSKAEVVDSLAEGAAIADIIFTTLSNDQVVESTIDEILASLTTSSSPESIKSKLIIESSTIHPTTTELLAEKVTASGAAFVAAPVFGAPAMADSGHLIGVLAGPAASVSRAKPYFKGVTSRGIIDMSDEPYGKALTLKLIGNTFILNMVEQLAEGHVLAEKSGLGTEYLHQWVSEMFPGPYAAYSTRMLSGDYYKREYPLFTVDLARKDAGHALSLAEAAGVRMRNAETGDAHLAQVKEHAGERGDIAGIYGAVRKEAGLKFENGDE